MDTLEDRDLVRLAVSGETWAFGRLVERYGKRVFGRIRRLVRHPDDVEDLVQEVFLLAYRRLGQLRDGSRFSPWLSTIADNTARTWRRRRMVQIRFEELLYREWSDPVVDESEAEREARMMVRQAVRRLSGAHRDVIEQHYFRGRSYADTARQLGLEVNTVRSRLQKARQRIRKEMNEMTTAGNTYDLTAQDLRALHWATRFVSDDESRPILCGVCLDTGGRVVGCDGARLLLRTLEGTEDLEKQVILGPGLETPASRPERVTLTIGEEQAVLKAGGEDELVIPILNEPYVNYEAVIPADVAREKADSPVSHDDAPWAGVPYWRFATSLDGRVNLEENPEPFRIHVNHDFLSDVISGIEVDGPVDVFFSDPQKALLFVPSDHPDRKAILMPMRME